MGSRENTIDCILLRHAETADIVSGRITGQRDIPLNANGRSQARAVAWSLAALGISEVVASDLARASETASIIAETLGLPPPHLDPRLRERHWGDRQGMAREATPTPENAGAPAGGESFERLRERVLTAIGDLRPRTLVVTHAGPIRVVLEKVGQVAESPHPCGWLDLHSPSEAPEEAELRVVTEVLTPGTFAGRVVYVAGPEDLGRIVGDSLILLLGCSKSVAVEAMDRAAATVNLMRALTAHLTHGRVAETPYAIAFAWPDGLPRDGQFARIVPQPPTRREYREPLPDIRPVRVADHTEIGGKAAGLYVLRECGASVPPFRVIPARTIETWVNGGDFQGAARAWVSEERLDPSAFWAVRSSADVEDSLADPMSGSFHSMLDCGADQVPVAIASVVASIESGEIRMRLGGRLKRRPRMAVIVQPMIAPARMAGAVFLPAPRDPATYLVEACWGETGDRLMGGRAGPNISARYDREGRPTEFRVEGIAAEEYALAETSCARVAEGALDIYLSTGRGDLEFAIDAQGQTWWLQARPLNEAVEIVDRRGFHPAAVAYYKALAFRVAEANRTPQAYFRCFDLVDGRFGYSIGIRHRDRAFHDRVLEDPRHLARVTEFGWGVERCMASMVSDLDARDPVEVLNLLTLHGAVQLPFSIPMDTLRMDRYQSEPTDGHPTTSILEGFAHKVSDRLRGQIDAQRLISLLRQPPRTLSVMDALCAHLELLRAGSLPTMDQVIGAIIPDLRDVPDLSEGGKQTLRQVAASMVADRARFDPDGCLLVEEISRKARARDDALLERNEFLIDAATRLDGNLVQELGLWSDYLSMKAETNETHCIYRGRCFVWFAEIGFRPISTDPSQLSL